MDATMMCEADAELVRARLHVRGGKRRLRQGKDAAIAKGIDEPTRRLDAAGESTQIENRLTRLGVMPFDETTLPPEEPTTP